MSAFVALRHKKLNFDLSTINLGKQENRETDFSTVSLTSRVPTLSDGDFSISESSAIAEYLEDVCASPSLYPKDIRDRARARQIQAWLRSDLMALRQERTTQVIFQYPSDQPLTELGKESAANLFKVATALLQNGNQNIFKEWCIADVDLALMINRLVANGDEVPHLLVKYVAHQWKHPAIQEWVNLRRFENS